jgi:hypothetical protein
LTYVAYQFTRRKQSIRRPENNDEAQISDKIIKNAELFAIATIEMIVYASEAVLNEKQDTKIVADAVKVHKIQAFSLIRIENPRGSKECNRIGYNCWKEAKTSSI